MASDNIKILVAEDDESISEIICYHLALQGYEVYTAFNGTDALSVARAEMPDLIILDIMMPKRPGTEVCEILRRDNTFAQTCILMLTALSDDATHIRCLEAGADDFISKPIGPAVLMSRVNALLRRTGKPGSKIIEHGRLVINHEKFEATVDSKVISLAKKEFELLYLLASHPGKVFLRNEILSEVWGNEVIVGDRTIDVHIRKIRQKTNLECITTIKGVGYKFALS